LGLVLLFGSPIFLAGLVHGSIDLKNTEGFARSRRIMVQNKQAMYAYKKNG
jgi:hypothetical protein